MESIFADLEARAGFARRLLAWFDHAKRPLPWRNGYEPYHVWISEIMLQQTQMERGVRYFQRWIETFPDIAAVAAAGEDAILAAWEGLGYYSRARNLHRAAKTIMEQHGGVFPGDIHAIRALPGVGEYTAGAIAAIAFNQPEPAIDANAIRIFARIGDIDAPVTAALKQRIAEVARRLIPVGQARQFTQAVMEMGALVCNKSPRCQHCPVAEFCLARQRGTIAERPLAKKKADIFKHCAAAAIIMHGNKVFLRNRPASGLWGGLWEFPNIAIDAPVQDGSNHDSARAALVCAVAEQTGLDIVVEHSIGTVKHGYTTNQVELLGYQCKLLQDLRTQPAYAPGGENQIWIPPHDAARYAVPAGTRKLMEKLGWK
ncbi:MAG: A/G-specific adenine glycosylase [Planctomycetes bacterium]|nr:A/G-specific adenine glycosylase [Planctomycetota bacterium]